MVNALFLLEVNLEDGYYGRCVMDAWWEARMALRPQRESLRFVAELLFPERPELRKMEIDASKMDEEWKNRPDEVLKYCIMDTLLPIEILDAIHAIRSKEALKLLFQKYLFNEQYQGLLVNGLIP